MGELRDDLERHEARLDKIEKRLVLYVEAHDALLVKHNKLNEYCTTLKDHADRLQAQADRIGLRSADNKAQIAAHNLDILCLHEVTKLKPGLFERLRKAWRGFKEE